MTSKELETECLQLLSLINRISKINLPSPLALRMFKSYVDLLGLEKTHLALVNWLNNNPSKLPSASDLKVSLDPDLDQKAQATILAQRVIDCVSKYGGYNHKEARLHMGEFAWSYFGEWLHWNSFCLGLYDSDIPVVRSQLRDSFHGMLKAEDQGINLVEYVENKYISDSEALTSLGFKTKTLELK